MKTARMRSITYPFYVIFFFEIFFTFNEWGNWTLMRTMFIFIYPKIYLNEISANTQKWVKNHF